VRRISFFVLLFFLSIAAFDIVLYSYDILFCFGVYKVFDLFSDVV